MNRCNTAVGAFLVVFLVGGRAYSCEPIDSPSAVDLVRQADSIIIARAMSYTTPSSSTMYGQNGEPESRIRFQVIGVLKGSAVGSELVLPGFLVDIDDFSDQRAPYTFVRSAGRGGNCFADAYRQGGSFLLLLKAQRTSGYTARWSPLAPLNEQLHSVDDPWVLWVRERLK